jgi:hypothetical protein
MTSLGSDFDTLLTRGAAAVLVVAGLWAVTVVAAVAVEARTHGRLRPAERTGCPPAVRIWLLGLFLAGFAWAAPSQADTGSGTGSAGAALGAALDGLPVPDRVSGVARPRAGAGSETVVVRAGDSLWRIARDRLPARADDATVARVVEELYALNRHTIGPDPDRLRPGQHLDLPRSTTLLEAS